MPHSPRILQRIKLSTLTESPTTAKLPRRRKQQQQQQQQQQPNTWDYLLHIVSSFCTCFYEHDIQLLCFPFTFLRCDLPGINKKLENKSPNMSEEWEWWTHVRRVKRMQASIYMYGSRNHAKVHNSDKAWCRESSISLFHNNYAQWLIV